MSHEIDDEEIFGKITKRVYDPNVPSKGIEVTTTRVYRRTMMGPLHLYLSRTLPDICDADGICDRKLLADILGLTHQAVFRWLQRNLMPATRAFEIIEYSRNQTLEGYSPEDRAAFQPASFEGLDQFLTR